MPPPHRTPPPAAAEKGPLGHCPHPAWRKCHVWFQKGNCGERGTPWSGVWPSRAPHRWPHPAGLLGCAPSDPETPLWARAPEQRPPTRPVRPKHKTHSWDKVDKLETGRTPLDGRMELNRAFLVQSREDAQGLITCDRANEAVFASSLRRRNDEDSEQMRRGHQPEKPAVVCGPIHIWSQQKNSLAGQPAGTASGEQGRCGPPSAVRAPRSAPLPRPEARSKQRQTGQPGRVGVGCIPLCGSCV